MFRGVLPTQILDVQAGEGQAVVFMWHKASKSKRLYAASVNSLDTSRFDPTGWSIVLMYNPGGGPGGAGRASQPMPKPPIQPDVTMGDPPPDEPPDVPMDYDDPDVQMPPQDR